MDEKSSLQQNIPLWERRDEILPLAERFIQLADRQVKTGRKELSKEAGEYILTHDWKDEQELEDAVKRACILSDADVLQREDFDIRQKRVKSIGGFIEERLKWFMRNIKRLEKFNLYDTVITEVEKALIAMVIAETGGNQLKAARLLGINRNTLRVKIKKLGINIKPQA